MKHAQHLLGRPLLKSSQLQIEDLPPNPPLLPRLALGGAICGSFAGSFAGALLGVAMGVIYRDISLGLDGALLGGVTTAVAGATYGLVLALREKRAAKKSTEG
jgi:hypothetical protein